MFKAPTIALVLVVVLWASVLGADAFISASAIGEFFHDIWDSRADNCYHGAHHRNQPPLELVENIKQWQIEKILNESRGISKDCPGTFHGCLTHTCFDIMEIPIFVINFCAPASAVDEEGRCVHNELDQICKGEGGHGKCEICTDGLCNEAKVGIKEHAAHVGNNGKAAGNGTNSADNKGGQAVKNGNRTDIVANNTGQSAATTVGNGMGNATTVTSKGEGSGTTTDQQSDGANSGAEDDEENAAVKTVERAVNTETGEEVFDAANYFGFVVSSEEEEETVTELNEAEDKLEVDENASSETVILPLNYLGFHKVAEENADETEEDDEDMKPPEFYGFVRVNPDEEK